LIDFGFAKIGEGEATALSSIALGTPGFMSPEQVNNLPLTEATDLYGLGATLICLLCKIQSKDFVDIVDYNLQIDFKTRVFGRVEGWYYPSPLSVRTVLAGFPAHGSRMNYLLMCM
ncbi:MAG: protein kinase domain-containing protein, partial [Microcystis panniformis]